ncbi:MAG: DUF3426 domain-containing protein [Sphingomonadales bacterium]
MIVTCENCSSRFVVDPKQLEPRGRRVRCARCKYVWFQAPSDEAVLSGEADVAAAQQEDRKQIFRRSGEAVADAAAPGPFTEPEPTPEPDDSAMSDAAAVDEDISSEADTPGFDDPQVQPEPASDDAPEPQEDETFPDLPWGKADRPRRSQVPAVYKERSPWLVAAGWAVLFALVASTFSGLIFARETIASKIPSTKPLYAAIGLEIEPEIIEYNVARYLRLETPPPPPADLRDGMIVQEVTGTITNTANAPVKLPVLEGKLLDRDNNELYRWVFSADTDVLKPGERIAFATEIVDMPQEAVEMELSFAENAASSGAAGQSDSYQNSR